MSLQNFIHEQAQKHERIETASRHAWWDLATLGDEKYARQFQESETALRNMYSSKEGYHYIRTHQHISDPFLSRQSTLLLNNYRENQIDPELIAKMVKLESEVEAIYANFRPLIDGTPLSNNDLKSILVESADSKARREAWEASKLIGEEVEQRVLTLVTLRNAAAKQAGFSDYYSMRLELQELDQQRLFAILDSLEKSTTPHWNRYKPQLDRTLAANCGVSVADLRPWHYHDPFFQEAPRQELNLDKFFNGKDSVEISRTFFQTIGLPVEDILARSDLFEREKKSQHAFCTCIDRKQDVRILCNMRDNEFWMGVLLHELGHAVYDNYIDQSLPYLLRTYAHTSTTESIAMLFGRLSKSGPFLHHYCSVDEKTAREVGLMARKVTAANLLVFARWILVMTHFERALYQQPGIYLNSFWWDCVERFQGVTRPANRHKPDWASKLHLACAPVYYQNYILGEMTASQLLHYLRLNVKTKDNELFNSSQVGEWLTTRLFNQGAQRPWEETLYKATGENLNPQYFAQDIEQGMMH